MSEPFLRMLFILKSKTLFHGYLPCFHVFDETVLYS